VSDVLDEASDMENNLEVDSSDEDPELPTAIEVDVWFRS
jgi:hypothetical protein